MGFLDATTDTSDRPGTFYLVAANGDLLWYRDLLRDGSNAPDGSTGWDARSGSRIGNGWSMFATVVCGGGGVLYGITPGGDLHWYRDLSRDGTRRWDPRSGARIGVGWNGFSQVVNGGDGVLYAVKPGGELLFYRDLRRDGTNAPDGSTGWDRRSGTRIGIGWGDPDVVAAGGGVLYAISSTGTLRWYRDLARDGTNGTPGSRGWHPRSGAAVGAGWESFTAVRAGGGGVLYGVGVDGFVLQYRDLAGDGTVRWDHGGVGATIGSGWFLTQPLDTTVQGYAVPLAASPGEAISFRTTSVSDFTVTHLRLRPGAGGSVGVPVSAPQVVAAHEQEAPLRAWRDGCRWSETFSHTVAAGAASGVYAAHCAGAGGTESHVVYVVRPGAEGRAPIAVLANTNTWNAYNDWGGRSKYSLPPAARLSFERPNPGTSPVDDGMHNHLTRAESWVLGWLEDVGFAADVWTDRDLHDGIDGLAEYRALVLSTHPEYWSAAMLDHLQEYLSGGGNLLYLGGNGLFERVDVDDDGALVLLGGDAASPRPNSYWRNVEPPRPERAILGVAYRYDNYQTFAPFRVLRADHRFFAGTGVQNGDLLGLAGPNGAASGWEMDTSIAGHAADGVIVSAEAADDRGAPPPGLQLLARGTNPGYGADLTYYEHRGGGFVLAAGSISVGGALTVDARLQGLVRNALNDALGL